MKDHIHVELPSGAIANVSPDCPPETLNALEAVAQAAKLDAEGDSSAATGSPYEMPQYAELGYKRLLGSLHKMVKTYRVKAKEFREMDKPWAYGKAKDCDHTIRVLKRIMQDHKKAAAYYGTYEENAPIHSPRHDQ